MRHIMLLAACFLAGCADPTPVAAIGLADGASVAVFGRSVLDIGVSAITGRDCSVVRLDKGQTYCAPTDPPLPERFCTRTLAAVDCWTGAELPTRTGVGDTPAPNPSQERYRAARWPKSLTFE
jgi:hypothetical protein